MDPSGAAAGALGGFTSVAATLWTRGLSFRIPIYFTVQWRSVSFSVGGSLGVNGWGDDRSYAGVSYRPLARSIGMLSIPRSTRIGLRSSWIRRIGLAERSLYPQSSDRSKAARKPSAIRTLPTS